MKSKIFVTGATGFVGTQVLKLLLEYGHNVTVLVRNPDRLKISHKNISIKVGDILEPDSLQSTLNGMDVVIHLVGIIREDLSGDITFDKLHTMATQNIISAAVDAGIKHFLHMSANGARENSNTDYHRTKFEAEQIVRSSGLNYTIFRPSVIYGPEDIFINMLVGFMKLTPVFSYFGRGDQPMQPVSVFEVAEIFARSINVSELKNKDFSICGSKVFTYKELLKMIMRVKGISRLLMPVPESIVKMAIFTFGKQKWFPLTRDQFVMLLEGNICENREIFELLAINSLDMETVLNGYLNDH